MNWARQQFGTILFADQCNEVGFSQDPEDVALNGLVADVGMFNWLLFAASLDPDLVDVFSRGSSGGDQALKLLVPRFTFEEYCAFVRFNFPILAPNDSAPLQRLVSGEEPLLTHLVEEITGFVPLQVYKLCLAVPRDQNPDEKIIRDCLSRFSASFAVEVFNKVEAGFFGAHVWCHCR